MAVNAMKYRTKPVEIEAIQWLYGDPDNDKEVLKLIGKDSHLFDVDAAINYYTYTPCIKSIVINNKEGHMKVFPGDYIIRGINGRYYTCSKDVFEKTYEEVKEND